MKQLYGIWSRETFICCWYVLDAMPHFSLFFALARDLIKLLVNGIKTTCGQRHCRLCFLYLFWHTHTHTQCQCGVRAIGIEHKTHRAIYLLFYSLNENNDVHIFNTENSFQIKQWLCSKITIRTDRPRLTNKQIYTQIVECTLFFRVFVLE